MAFCAGTQPAYSEPLSREPGSKDAMSFSSLPPISHQVHPLAKPNRQSEGERTAVGVGRWGGGGGEQYIGPGSWETEQQVEKGEREERAKEDTRIKLKGKLNTMSWFPLIVPESPLSPSRESSPRSFLHQLSP